VLDEQSDRMVLKVDPQRGPEQVTQWVMLCDEPVYVS
jgi:hypothetical protein